MAETPVQITLASPDETCRLARRLGAVLAQGDTILLSGGVGAGKTHFARCLIQSRLDQPEDIPSPTYTLVQTYPTSTGEIWHADLYRLSDASEIEELGLFQAFSDEICLIEWPDRLGPNAPENALMLSLDAPSGDDRREAKLSWSDTSWDRKLGQVLDD